VKEIAQKYLQLFSLGDCYVEGGMKFLIKISLYLGNDTRYKSVVAMEGE